MASHSPLSGGRNKSFRDPGHTALLEAQDAILALLDSGAKLDAVLERIAREIDGTTNARCAITLADAEHGTQRLAAMPNLNDAQLASVERALAGC
jgi:hypothetical protein